MTYYWSIEQVVKRSIIPVDYWQTLQAAERAGKSSSGAIYFPADTSPAVATVAARYILECESVEFAGMVMGAFPAYRPAQS